MTQIPAGWRKITAEEYCLKVADWTHDSPKPTDEWFFLATSKNIKNWILDLSSAYKISSSDFEQINKRSKVDKRDILFSMIWTVWEVCLLNMQPNFAIKNVWLFKCWEKEKSQYLYYYLKSPFAYHYVISRLNGTTQKYITLWDLRSLPIHLPPLPEQQAIAAVLSSFDDKIELLRAENQTFEQMGQELFKERFGKWKIGDELPEGWRVGKLGEKNFAEIIGSWIERFDREKIYLATADVINSSISNSNTKITYQDRPSRANMQPTEKSIWFAKMQDSRKLLMFDDYSQNEIENYILSTWFAGIKTSELSHYYLWCFVLSDDFDMIKNNMANGAVQIALNNSNLEKIEILIPNEEFLRKFNEFVKPLFKKIYLNNKQITSLSATRDHLLPKLMSGEVRVKF